MIRAAGLAILLGLAAIAPAAAERLVMGLALAPAGLDPHGYVASSDTTVNSNIYEALVRIGADGLAAPALASAWVAEGERTWRFTLRPGVRFHDGSPFAAADVIASFARVRALKTSLRGLASKLQAVAGIEAIGEGALRIHTHAAAPLLAYELSNVPILPRTATDATDPEAFNSGQAAIGTGPFRYAAFQPDARLDLRRNDAWWDSPPPWRTVSLRFIPRDPVRAAALLAGDVDVIERVAPADAPVLAARAGIALYRAPGRNAVYVILNQAPDQGGPYLAGPGGEALAANPLRDLRVRQALSLALDREALAERLLAGAAAPASQLAPLGAADHVPIIPAIARDLPQSRALLAAAGLPDGLRLVLHAPANRITNAGPLAEAVAQMWSRAGVATTVEAMPWVSLARRAGRGDFAAMIYNCCASSPDTVQMTRDILATPDPQRQAGSSNWGRYANPALDRLLEAGMASFDPAAQAAANRAAAAVVAADIPIIPLYHPTNIWASRRPFAYAPRLDGRSPAIGASHAP